MPTSRRRLNITPSDAVWLAVEELHRLTGQARAGIITDMLDGVAPIFLEQVKLMQRLASTPDQARELVMQFGTQGIHTISQQMLELPPVPKKRGRPRKNAAP